MYKSSVAGSFTEYVRALRIDMLTNRTHKLGLTMFKSTARIMTAGKSLRVLLNPNVRTTSENPKREKQKLNVFVA